MMEEQDNRPRALPQGAPVAVMQGKRRVSGQIAAAAWDGRQWLYTVDLGGYTLPRVPVGALLVDASAYVTPEEEAHRAHLDRPALDAA